MKETFMRPALFFVLCAASALPFLVGCMPQPGGSQQGINQKKQPGLTASLFDTSGTNRIGNAALAQKPGSSKTQLSLNVVLPNGTYGMHLHSIGQCNGPDFASAGPHWNPMAKQHGFDNPMGTHAGDLPNLVITKNGAEDIQIDFGPVALTDVLDADGTAIIIHAKPDDYKTDPSGNSGTRIICGVFTKGT
jgi:superoxide dismutase, Cu-Zn family